MATESKVAKSKITIGSGATTEECATKIFTKSGYPKTVRDNFKLVLNFLFNFLS